LRPEYPASLITYRIIRRFRLEHEDHPLEAKRAASSGATGHGPGRWSEDSLQKCAGIVHAKFEPITLLHNDEVIVGLFISIDQMILQRPLQELLERISISTRHGFGSTYLYN
jgi:hypothetical protein